MTRVVFDTSVIVSAALSSLPPTERATVGVVSSSTPSFTVTCPPWEAGFPARRWAASGGCSRTGTARSGTHPSLGAPSVSQIPRSGRYLDQLTEALIVRQLQPWCANLRKRQVKMPQGLRARPRPASRSACPGGPGGARAAPEVRRLLGGVHPRPVADSPGSTRRTRLLLMRPHRRRVRPPRGPRRPSRRLRNQAHLVSSSHALNALGALGSETCRTDRDRRGRGFLPDGREGAGCGGGAIVEGSLTAEIESDTRRHRGPRSVYGPRHAGLAPVTKEATRPQVSRVALVAARKLAPSTSAISRPLFRKNSVRSFA